MDLSEKKQRSGIMLCQPFEERRLWGAWRNAWNEDFVIMQPKLDGERCRALRGASGLLLLSSTEEVIQSAPLINEALERAAFPWEVDGELYVHGWAFEQIHSVVSRSQNQHPLHEKMELWLFDYVSDEPQIQRLVNLKKHYEGLPATLRKQIKLVPSSLVYSMELVMQQFESYVRNGFEGMIIRHPFAGYERKRLMTIMKFKPKKHDCYRVVGWQEEVALDGMPKGRLGALICESAEGESFAVSAGLDDAARKRLWAERDLLPGQFCVVHYQALTEKRRVPKFVSKIELVDQFQGD